MDNPNIFFLSLATFIVIYGMITYKYYTGTISNLEQKINTLHVNKLAESEKQTDAIKTTNLNIKTGTGNLPTLNKINHLKYPVPVQETAFRSGTIFNPSLDTRPNMEPLTPELQLPIITVSGEPIIDSRRIVTSIGPEHFPLSSGQQLVGYVASTSPTEDTVMKLYEMVISAYARIFSYYVIDKNEVAISLGTRTEEFEDGDVISIIPGYESVGPFKITLYKTGHLVYM